MKKLFITVISAMPFVSYARQEIKTDSISNTLDEVVVTAGTRIETGEKVVLHPTEQEKKHSTNGYALLANMNLPDFSVNASAKTISTITGRNVILLINGVEASDDELATLSASEIVLIDYRRDPGGRYAGSGAVINFITMRYDYGGNVYLSADEGLARQYGEYTGMISHKKKAISLSLTANGKWDNISQLTRADNTAVFTGGTLFQNINPIEAKTHTDSQYLKFKFTHAADNHTLDLSALLKRNATPRNSTADEITYSGISDFTSHVSKKSRDRSILPAIGLKYNLFIPGNHTITLSSEISHSHTSYRSLRNETGFDDIINDAVENTLKAGGNITYFKSLANGLSLGASLDEYYNHFRDIYSGSFNGRQTLTNNHSMILFHADHNIPGVLSCYASAGIANLYSTIGEHKDNQCSPMAFYGLTYAINPKNVISVTGSYAHSIYDPSYKNNAVICTSFFEATMGNPELEQLKAFQNLVSYNGRAGHFELSFSYDFLKYFKNTSYRYFTDGDIMYHQLVNDGNFQYHKLILGLSANLLDNNLRLKADATYSMNRFNSEYRPLKRNDWRTGFSASYIFGDWQIKGSWSLPYKVMGIEGTEIRYPAQYGLSLDWQHGCWAAKCCAENFLDRRQCTRIAADYGVYRSLSQSSGDLSGRNISISLTYILSYGKKTDREQIFTDSKINSAILRPF